MMAVERSGQNLRVFRNRDFTKFAHKNRIKEAELCTLVVRLQAGGLDADLGGGVIKQRLARPGQGKSGSYRTILFYRGKHAVLFVLGFAKNDRSNITDQDLLALRRSAKEFLSYDEQQISNLLKAGALEEICREKAYLPE